MTETQFHTAILRGLISDIDRYISDERRRAWQPWAALVLSLPLCFFQPVAWLAVVGWLACALAHLRCIRTYERLREDHRRQLLALYYPEKKPAT